VKVKTLFGLFLLIALMFSACASTNLQIPIVHDPVFQNTINEEGQRIVSVTKNASKSHLYQFHIAEWGHLGLSVGNHTIYIGHDLAEGPEPEDLDFLRVILAHEIAHDVLGHKVNRAAIATAKNIGELIGDVIGYAPGIIGLAGQGVSLISNLGGMVTDQLYSRSAELEADRLGIDFWKRLGWDCSPWVNVFELLLERGPGGGGDFTHPTTVRILQAADLCLPLNERQQVYKRIQTIEAEQLEREFKEAEAAEPEDLSGS